MSSVLAAMGFEKGQAVQELGWDSDVDEEFRTAVMDAIDDDLLEDAVEAVDTVLLWWRDDDGDLVDGLVDALRDLGEHGHIWLMTPKVGRPGAVEAADVSEAAVTAGMTLANTSSKASSDWLAQKIVRPKAGKK